MENISIGIVSSNKGYGKALSVSLMAVCDDFIIRLYDTRQFVSEWNEYDGEDAFNEKFDIVLWDGKEIEESYVGNIVYLAEKASMVKKDFKARKFSIYKYSGAAAISASIFEIYSFLTGRGSVFVRKDRVSLFAFGSWEGGCGCTTVSIGVAQEMRRFLGCKVLIVSLETIESTSKFFETVPELKSIGEYLYRVLPEEDILGDGNKPFIDSYVVKDLYGVEAFAPSRGKNPLDDLDESEIQKFIASLIDSGRYDAIIIDMGTCLSEAATAVIELADKVCFVTRSVTMTHREEIYLGHMVCRTREKTLMKAIRVTNMVRESDMKKIDQSTEKSDFINASALVRIRIGEESALEPEQLMLEGGFGEDIRKLTGMLRKNMV